MTEGVTFALNGPDWELTGWARHQWRIGSSMELGAKLHPLVSGVKASVPGAVQTDLMRAGRLPDPNMGLRSLDIEWVNNRDWVYKKRFTLPDGWLRDRCELVLEGLDDTGEVFFNGRRLTGFEGMFSPLRLDVTALLRPPGEENELAVAFAASEEVDGQIGYSSRIRRLKSRFNYGWDWCPRIVPVGIWRDVYLHSWHDLKVADAFPQASWEGEDRGKVAFRTEVDALRAGAYTFEYRVEDERGGTVYEQRVVHELHGGVQVVEQAAAMEGIRLWWPNGWGEQPLYRASVAVRDGGGVLCDAASRTIGFRRVEFVPNPGAPADALPYTLLVNGRRIFLRGVNWVPIRPFYGDVSAGEYALQLGRMKSLHANLLRVWGGAINEKREFYEYCDRNGLMVWQEFLQSSSGIDNCPPEDARFLEDELEPASRTMVRERRHHPSHIVWCGGNELMWDDYVPVHERHRNIALLHRIVREEDPGKPFLPASASGPTFCDGEDGFGKGVHHDVHGPWDYLGDADHYRFFNRNDALLRTESGTPGISRQELLERFADGRPVWPPTADNPYWVHRGSFWIQWEQLSRLFGPWSESDNELRAYAQASRYMQLESLRYMAEATRRREPSASGFVVWMGNEPFANNANTSLLEFDGVPKPAYYGVRGAFAERHASARYERVAWRSGEQWSCELYVHDDRRPAVASAAEPPPPGRLRARLVQADGVPLREATFAVERAAAAEEAADGGSTLAGLLEWEVTDVPNGLVLLFLELEAGGDFVPVNAYVFTVGAKFPFEPLRRLPAARLDIGPGRDARSVVVKNAGDMLAAGVFAIPKTPERTPILDRNYLFLLPGEEAALSAVDGSEISPGDYAFEGLNV